MKRYLSVPLAFVSLLLVGALLVVGSFCIPRSLVVPHVRESLDVMRQEGQAPAQFGGGSSSSIDNFAGAIMLNIAVSGTGDPLVDAFASRRYVGADAWDQLEALDGALQHLGDATGNYGSYARYWHGYLVVLKPLLILFNIVEIRFILLAGLILLLFWQCAGLMRDGHASAGLALLVAYIAGNIPVMATSIAHAPSFFLALAGVSWVRHVDAAATESRADEDKMLIGFMLMGGLTSYLDFLGAPLVSLGLPLGVLVALRMDGVTSARQALALCVRCLVLSVCWIVGYAGIWALKWPLSTLVTGSDIVRDAMSQLSIRATNSTTYTSLTEGYSRLDAIAPNFAIMFPSWLLKLLAVLVVVACVALVWRRNLLRVRSWWWLAPLSLLASYPFFWYICASNHSLAHHHFTYRALMVTVHCLALACVRLCELFLPQHGDRPVAGHMAWVFDSVVATARGGTS